jgi:hypothetical protein
LKKKYKAAVVVSIFAAYSFVATERIPPETVFIPRWITSLDDGKNAIPSVIKAEAGLEKKSTSAASAEFIPFELGRRFGYVNADGVFSINKEKTKNIYISPSLFAEYGGVEEKIEINNPSGGLSVLLENPQGRPFFLDDKIFLINYGQYSISRLGDSGAALWTRDFPSVITCVDGAAGILAVGMLDGSVEIVSRTGELIYEFEPSGSRIGAVFGCALSSDGSALAVVCGIGKQRFLYLEQAGSTWRITYHEFLEEGLRRPVYISFTDGNRRVVFERENSIGVYDSTDRIVSRVFLDGRVAGIDASGENGILLLLTSDAGANNKLIAIQYPGVVVMEAPFKSKTVFLSRKEDVVFLGGDSLLASFNLEKR